MDDHEESLYWSQLVNDLGDRDRAEAVASEVQNDDRIDTYTLLDVEPTTQNELEEKDRDVVISGRTVTTSTPNLSLGATDSFRQGNSSASHRLRLLRKYAVQQDLPKREENSLNSIEDVSLFPMPLASTKVDLSTDASSPLCQKTEFTPIPPPSTPYESTIDVWRDEPMPDAWASVCRDLIFTEEKVTVPPEVDDAEDIYEEQSNTDMSTPPVSSSVDTFTVRVPPTPPPQCHSHTIPSSQVITSRDALLSRAAMVTAASTASEISRKALNQSIAAASVLASTALSTLQIQLRESVALAAAVAVASESGDVIADRARSLTTLARQHLSSDVAERRRQERLQSTSEWSDLLRRCALASLPVKQRRLLRETVAIDDENDGNTTPLVQLLRDAQQAAASSNPTGGFSLPPLSQDHNNTESDLSGEAAAASLVRESLCESDDSDIRSIAAKHFVAPPFAEASACHSCGRIFGMTAFRHHCRCCGASVCGSHSRRRRAVPRYGFIDPVRVCDHCADGLDECHRREALVWRAGRVRDYLAASLIPYPNDPIVKGWLNSESSGSGKGEWLAGGDWLAGGVADDWSTEGLTEDAANLAITAISSNSGHSVPLPKIPTVLRETLAVLKRHGAVGFAAVASNDGTLAAVETLRRLINLDDLSAAPHELSATLCYRFVIDRSLRGVHPEAESVSHRSTLGRMWFGKTESYTCNNASESDLASAIRYAPLALSGDSFLSSASLQRLGALQRLELLSTNADEIISANNGDVAMAAAIAADLDAGASILSSAGLDPSDGSVVLVENGGDFAIASLLSVSLFAVSRRAVTRSVDSNGDGLPPSREAVLVLRGNISLDVLSAWQKAPTVAFPPPWYAVLDCLSGGPTLGATPPTVDELQTRLASLPPETQAHITAWGHVAAATAGGYVCRGVLAAALGVLRSASPSLLQLAAGGYDIRIAGHGVAGAIAAVAAFLLRVVAPSTVAWSYGCPPVMGAAAADALAGCVTSVILRDDLMARLTPASSGALLRELLVYRSSVFRHPKQDWKSVLQRTKPLRSPSELESFADGIASTRDDPEHSTATLAVDGGGSDSEDWADDWCDASSSLGDAERPAAFWLPGRILHIYEHRGQPRVSEVSRTFPSLRRVEVQPSMLVDGKSTALLSALLESRAVRRCKNLPPRWMSFDASDNCTICQHNFDWPATFRGTHSEFHERHNCRCCGALVCGHCSRHARPLPRLGLVDPRRICDRCFHNGDYALI